MTPELSKQIADKIILHFETLPKGSISHKYDATYKGTKFKIVVKKRFLFSKSYCFYLFRSTEMILIGPNLDVISFEDYLRIMKVVDNFLRKEELEKSEKRAEKSVSSLKKYMNKMR